MRTQIELEKKYLLLSEKASLALRKEMFKPGYWDDKNDRPYPQCWTETGDIKDECWAAGPGGTNSVDGGAIVDSNTNTEPMDIEDEICELLAQKSLSFEEALQVLDSVKEKISS